MSADEAEIRDRLAYEAGQLILRRAMKMKADGDIRDFQIFCDEKSPHIIDHIGLIR